MLDGSDRGQRRHRFNKIRSVRANRNGATEPRRLQRILAAMRDQAAADKSDAAGRIEQAQLAKRIGQPYPGTRRRPWPLRPEQAVLTRLAEGRRLLAFVLSSKAWRETQPASTRAQLLDA